MATFDDVYTSQDEAFRTIWDLVNDAIEDLRTIGAGGGFISEIPAIPIVENLHFDPGAPNTIVPNPDDILADILSRINDLLNDLAAIEMPNFPDAINMTMLDHEVWQSYLTPEIKRSISDYIVSLGIPDVSYQNAIYNEDYERNKIILEDLYDLADAKTGARGFTYTNDFGNSLKIDAQVKYQYDRTQVSRTIVKTLTEWARDNYQFAIKAGIDYETMQMDFTYKYCTAFVSIYKELIAALLDKFKAEIESVLAPMGVLINALNGALEVTKVHAEIDKTNETLKQSRSGIQISEGYQKYQADTQRKINELKERYDSLRAATNHAAALAQASNKSVIGYVKK